MRRRRSILSIPLVMLLAGCSEGTRAGEAGVSADAGASAIVDGSIVDGSIVDASIANGSIANASIADASIADASIADAGDAGASDTRPRLGSIAPTTWIFTARTKNKNAKLGYLRPGTSVALLDPAPVEDPKRRGECKSGRWFRVDPEGFVCEDETTTRDLQSPLFRALAAAAPRDAARPYDWAFSTRAPMYPRVPSAADQRKAERRLRPVAELAKVPRSTAGHEDLAILTPPPARDPRPDFFSGEGAAPALPGTKKRSLRREIPYGSMLSYAASFDIEGRTFLLSPDLTLVPADRVRPFRATTFHGVHIDAAHPLPLGWFRKDPRAKMRRNAEGSFTDSGDRFPPRTHVGLTGVTAESAGETYWETREAGVWARAKDLSVVSEPADLPRDVGPEEIWIDASLSRGTLSVLRGKRVLFSTLMSPGAGGVTQDAKMSTADLVRAALTPLGAYRVWFKHQAAQMTSEDKPDPESFWIADVPWVQYFRPPFAIHTAYWHEDFGQPKSGGCINLSPEDARVVFELTLPHLPAGWAGRITQKDEGATLIVIRK